MTIWYWLSTVEVMQHVYNGEGSIDHCMDKSEDNENVHKVTSGTLY